MHRVFALDVHACPRCGGRLRVIATVQDPLLVQAILAHLRRSGAPSRLALPRRLGRNRVDSSLDQALKALLLPPCTSALTASPWRRRITGGQRACLTPTLAFASSTAPFRAHRRGSRGRPDCLDAGPPRRWRQSLLCAEKLGTSALERYADMRPHPNLRDCSGNSGMGGGDSAHILR